MHKLKLRILDCFKLEQSRPLSTSFLVEKIFEDELNTIKVKLNDEFISKEAKKDALLTKAKYHRQLLHHLNMLVDDQILKVAGTEGKGEKIFAPILDANQELIVSSKRQKIVLSSSSIPAMPIEQYEHKKIVYRFASNQWLQRLNAVLIETQKFDRLDDLYKVIADTILHINDVIALNDIEHLLVKNSVSDVINFIEQTLVECKNYGIRLCLIVDATNIVIAEPIDQFLHQLAKTKYTDYVTVVFEVTNRELIMHRDLFERIIQFYARHNLKLNLKNDDVHQPPYIIGKAGPYTLNLTDWKAHQQDQNSTGICICQSTILLDISAFFLHNKLASQFHECMNAIARSLCIANSMQRKNQNEYFRHILNNKIIQAHSFFNVANQTIRLLNYQQYLTKSNETLDATTLQHLIRESQEQVNQISANQSIIFLSCGMPLRFSIGLAQAYRRGVDDLTQSDNYIQTITIKDAKDLYSKQVREQLMMQENFKSVFEYGFELRCVREGRTTAQEVFGEISLLLSSYKFPLICYKFSLLEEENLTLKQFMSDKQNTNN